MPKQNVVQGISMLLGMYSYTFLKIYSSGGKKKFSFSLIDEMESFWIIVYNAKTNWVYESIHTAGHTKELFLFSFTEPGGPEVEQRGKGCNPKRIYQK